MKNVFSTVRNFYGLLIQFAQLVFKCATENPEEGVKSKRKNNGSDVSKMKRIERKRRGGEG